MFKHFPVPRLGKSKTFLFPLPEHFFSYFFKPEQPFFVCLCVLDYCNIIGPKKKKKKTNTKQVAL